jgi:hypothetical protein
MRSDNCTILAVPERAWPHSVSSVITMSKCYCVCIGSIPPKNLSAPLYLHAFLPQSISESMVHGRKLHCNLNAKCKCKRGGV